MACVIGIDAGGTKTVGILADATGEVLWEGTLPGTVGALLNMLKQYGGD